jgi:hypothetical protein
MDLGKRGTSNPAERKTSTDTNPDPDGPLDEIRLPPHDPVKGRAIDEPGARRKRKVGDDGVDLPEEDDDDTGEMASAGQDLGLTLDDEREAVSIEDASLRDAGLEDEEADWIDHDDDTDKGRGAAGD